MALIFLDNTSGFAVSLAKQTSNLRLKFIPTVDPNMDAKQHAVRIVAGLKKAGIDFVATLPDEKMVEVIRTVEGDPELKHIPLCREEEGIGICAGAYLAGKKTALIMQNAGFLNSCNALTTTCLQFQIPILLLIYYAGDMGDRGFTTLGSVTEPSLQALGIRYAILRKADEVDETLCGAQILAEDSKKPVAVLLTKTVLGVK
ncbi:MAG TPA: thiamine pyrophosphate-binding protein [Candidatus Acidoferrum sp.]|nr:thiamine pyrophosphate-binding protein [Candidatus Acidoferrum sp.]